MPIPETVNRTMRMLLRRSDIWDLSSSSLNFSIYLFMSTLANESLLETFFEEALEEIGISEDSLFYADAYKTAQSMAMNKFLSNNP